MFESISTTSTMEKKSGDLTIHLQQNFPLYQYSASRIFYLNIKEAVIIGNFRIIKAVVNHLNQYECYL